MDLNIGHIVRHSDSTCVPAQTVWPPRFELQVHTNSTRLGIRNLPPKSYKTPLLIDIYPVEDLDDLAGLASSRVHLGYQTTSLDFEFPNDPSGVLKAAGALHVRDGISLDSIVGGLLFEDVDQLEVGRIGADGVDDREGEFALGQILAQAFVLGICPRRQIQVVIADLEDEPHQVDERDTVDLPPLGRLGLHQLDGQAEQASGLVLNHLQIVVLGGAGQCVPPIKVHSLASVQVE